MSANSKIEWTDHTFNPWWGCTKISPACKNCYAESFSKRTGNKVWGDDAPRRFFGDKHWSEPLKWNAAAEREGARRRVFCASMADVFEVHLDPSVAEQQDKARARLGWLIDQTQALDWLLLTKRPQNWPACYAHMGLSTETPRKNIWLGVTVEDQQRANERLWSSIWAPAAVHFVSYEPALGPVDLRNLDFYEHVIPALFERAKKRDPSAELEHYPKAIWQDALTGDNHSGVEAPRVDWIIAGGESGASARPPHPQWFRDVRDQCADAGVPFFFKQWGEWAPLDVAGSDESGEWAPVKGKQALDRIHQWPDGELAFRIGKSHAGRLLDGREHSAFPPRING